MVARVQADPRRARTWYHAHNTSIASAYLAHEDLARAEGRVERFFIICSTPAHPPRLRVGPRRRSRLAPGALAPRAAGPDGPSRRLVRFDDCMAEYRIEALTPQTWEAYARLMERHNGVFGGCWCTYFQTMHDDKTFDADDNRSLKQRLVDEGRAHAAT